jgi:hypothetical protein
MASGTRDRQSTRRAVTPAATVLAPPGGRRRGVPAFGQTATGTDGNAAGSVFPAQSDPP